MTATKLKLAALTLFTESGYEGTSMSQIAKAVGIKTPSIYAHFESKEHLFLTLVEFVIQEDCDQLLRIIAQTADQPPLERVRAVFNHYSDRGTPTMEKSFLKRAIMVPPRHLRERLRQDFDGHERFLTHHIVLLFRGCMDGGAELDEEEECRLIALFYALVDGLIVERELYDKELFLERQEQLWAWFCKAITCKRG
ncbi:TetR/AcrR family transcriptional regulator [Paenibacillus mendelii]|uniref:TetR/AcrR family transcriptional regulator n=1 Tax=Paenibacillus mendelii TaxID=206163 RepID=A0ABV6J3S5_9BACL|nr:TetR/AcrR family transcriptional regulator [Paenibacillus mendelii]MCQ6561965.1 TetR/AcrR family transcriptional regulator [Paenibacillus mendelii]